MAITTTEREQVIKLVVLMFNAAPGATYLNDIVAAYEALGHNLGKLATALAGTGAYQQIHPNFETAEEFASSFLTPLGLQANAEATAFVVAGINAGKSKAQISYEAYVALNATTSADFADAKAILQNKTDVAEYYSIDKAIAETNLGQLQAALTGVTADPATVTAAEHRADDTAGQHSGQTFTLTTAQDNIKGSAGNDTILAYVNNGVANGQTLSAADLIDGGQGTDTVSVTVEGTTGTIALDMKNVETIKVRNVSNSGQSFDLGGATGLGTVAVEGSNGYVGFLGLKSLVDAVITNPTDNNETVALQYDLTGFAATATQKLTVTGTASGVDGGYQFFNAGDNSSGFGTFDIVSAGSADNGVYLGTDNTAFKTLKVSGAGNLSVYTYTGQIGALATVDASGMTGDFFFSANGSTKALTITGGTGGDTITMSGVAGLTHTVNLGAGNDTLLVGTILDTFGSTSKLDGGEGTDIINIADGADLTKATAAEISGFETLDVSGGTGVYDLSLEAFEKVQINAELAGALAGDVEFKNTAAASTLDVYSFKSGNFTVNGNITATLKTAAGTADALTINVHNVDGDNDSTAEGAVTFGTITAAATESITINATATNDTGVSATKYVTTIADLVAADVKTLTISGNASVVLTAVTNTGNTLTKVDAGGSTGNVTLDLSAVTKQVAYTGSSAVDAYTATDGGSIKGGSGNDQITLVAAGTKADTVIYTAGTDSSFKDANADSKIDAGTIETINGFVTASAAGAGGIEADVIDLTTFAFAGYQRGAVNKGTLASAVEAGTFASTSADFFADAGGDRGTAYGTVGTDTYLFVDADKDGNFSAATDLVIKLAGVTDFATTSVAF